MNKILIVDDEPLIRRALERIFLKEGHQVDSAADGISGLELWLRNNYHIVILDILMPGLKGTDVVEKRGHHNSKVVLMSAYSGELTSLGSTKALDLNNCKHDLFLSKPFSDIIMIKNKIMGLINESSG